jgi:hypothetical protein
MLKLPSSCHRHFGRGSCDTGAVVKICTNHRTGRIRVSDPKRSSTPPSHCTGGPAVLDASRTINETRLYGSPPGARVIITFLKRSHLAKIGARRHVACILGHDDQSFSVRRALGSR